MFAGLTAISSSSNCQKQDYKIFKLSRGNSGKSILSGLTASSTRGGAEEGSEAEDGRARRERAKEAGEAAAGSVFESALRREMRFS